jgi:hypothetical protein
MDKLRENSAVVSIDLLVAMVLVMVAVIMAIQILPAVSHEDRDWRIKQYMTAVRATDNLVQDTGDTGWEANWIGGNYSNVTKIGFVDNNSISKVLNETKIRALMGAGYPDSLTGTATLYWWEFPNSSTSQAERDNAAQALGLTGYNFYMQLHPVGLNPSQFNSAPLVTNLTNRSQVPINNDTATVIDRYVYIKKVSGDCEFICYYNATLKKDISVQYRLNLWVW